MHERFLTRSEETSQTDCLCEENFLTNSIRGIGIVLLVLGLLAFVVPIPHSEDHSLKIGDAKVEVQTESSQKLPPAVGIVLIAGGVLALVLGSRKT